MLFGVHPLIALGVLASTAATDAAYVFFNAAVSGRQRIRAANWSAIWYMLSAFAVISYTENAVYVLFAAAGSWLGRRGRLLARRLRLGDLAPARPPGCRAGAPHPALSAAPGKAPRRLDKIAILLRTNVRYLFLNTQPRQHKFGNTQSELLERVSHGRSSFVR